MSRKKLRRFAELDTFSNVFYRGKAGPGGQWLREFFGNENPVILELGCGKGEYSLELARLQPGRSVLGVDRKGERLWKGAKRALELGIGNVAFLRARIEDLANYLDPGQVEEIWMPYPDPLPKRRQAKHRIVAPDFLNIYRSVLRPGGQIRIKTDDLEFYKYVLETATEFGAEICAAVPDLYADELETDLLGVQTTFEIRHLGAGKVIKYLAFRFVD